MPALPIFAPDAVERALLAQAGQSIPVAVAVTATRPTKFTVPSAPPSIVSWTPVAYDLGNAIGFFMTSAPPNGVQTITFNIDSSAQGFNIEPSTCSTLTTLSWPTLTTISSGNLQVGPSTSIISLLVSELATVAGVINLGGFAALPALSFPALISCGGFFVQNSPVLTTISAPILATVGADGIEINSDAELTTIDFPSLTASSGLINAEANPDLMSVSFPVLTTCGGLTLSTDTALISASFPILAHITGASNGVTVTITALTSISLPELVDIIVPSGFAINANPSLTAVSLPKYVPAVGAVDDFSNNALSVATVNAILAEYVSRGLTAAGTLNLASQTPAAPPSGAGITNAALLVTNGWTVTTD